MQTILCRLPNWVGDVVMTLPSLDLLRKQQIEPILFGKPWIHELLAGFQFECHSLPADKWAAVKRLRQHPARHLLLFTNSFSSALLGRLAGKTVIGYQKDGRSLLLNQRFHQPNETLESKVFYHLTCGFLELPPHPMSTPHLRLSNTCQEKTQKIIKEYQLPENFIMLCPFAHGRNRQGELKTWPHWQEFYQQMQSYSLVICPGPNEVLQALQDFPKAIVIPNVALDQYAALASHAKLVITNDSGPMHLAAAVCASTIALFGATDPKRSAPFNVDVLGDYRHWPTLAEVLQVCRLRLS